MPLPARLTQYFEVHYVLHGVKKVIVVEKTTMSELDAWICAMLFAIGEQPQDLVRDSRVEQVREIASAHGLQKVRWNRVQKMGKARPSLFFYGDVMAQGIFMKAKDSQT
ncbi:MULTISPECIES: DUF6555 family protein [unclassified Pseudomonas]|uniref:DUF6555 family protein n=1 Tax=unclassified Pseudomonas TaxID=196821 RepID=UPI000BDD1BD3|nr:MULTISPECIES: DUF6555 family protein [unclassified Pseudomonas]PVZ19890.1 hypothetical protein F474_00481 [Pseudomonas sp. URIL14HWK12:I12]PVZ26956.1 hypothetical protein F470_00136 [Pseudomonas sp. URIL14HWK12:I10]PVZ37845.1 hypothetical protein F472_00481 [Pseudomonas sp. URIL14HWK12:I11]SNZ05437.1 hypothetical protein SAMN05660463_00923 [Pseudomonas sp. URIL14HWK12:I9]